MKGSYDELMKSILTAQEQMLQHSIEANSVTLNGRKYGKLIENVPPNMKPTVFGMAVKADYALPDDYDFLVQYEPSKPTINTELKSCPFCGGVAKTQITSQLLLFSVMCENCGSKIAKAITPADTLRDGVTFEVVLDVMNTVIDMWNRREE